MQSAPVYTSRKPRSLRNLGVVAFLAFLLKGVAWLVLPIAFACGAAS